MTHARLQQGMTLVSWVFVLLILVFLVIFLLRVVPAYMEDFSVSSSLKSLKEDSFGTYSTPEQVLSAILRRLSVNNVDNVTAEDIEISRTGATFNVNVEYEVREPFLFNIDLVLTFNHRLEVQAR